MLERSGVHTPQAIRAQFLFEREIMLKMFLGAAGTSAIVLVVLNSWFPSAFQKAREARGWGDKGLVTSIVGGMMQGAGMALSGACPGMVLAQLGSGIPTALATLLGGVAGAALYSVMHPWLEEHQVRDFHTTFAPKFASMHVNEFFKLSFPLAALTFSATCLAVAVAVESAQPWKSDLVGLHGASPLPLNPIVAGGVVGLLQLPAFLLLDTFLGASTAYSVVSGQWIRLLDADSHGKFMYAKSMLTTKGAWQVYYAIGTVAGAWLSSGLSVSDEIKFFSETSTPHGVMAPYAFAGGVLMVFGARFAGGCTSGHGISGLGLFNVNGWIVVPFMFASGTATALLMTHAVGHDAFLLTV
jgi:uncharacterized membrane protein YedE/YeeE